MKGTSLALVALTAIAIGEGVVLIEHVDERATVAALRVSDQKRRDFCAAFRSLLNSAEYNLRSDTPSANTVGMWAFTSLAIPPFFDACDVDWKPLAEEIQRADECWIIGPDYRCVAEVAREVLDRVPRYR